MAKVVKEMNTSRIIDVMNCTENAKDIGICRRELKKRGYSAVYDAYVNEWVLC